MDYFILLVRKPSCADWLHVVGTRLPGFPTFVRWGQGRLLVGAKGGELVSLGGHLHLRSILAWDKPLLSSSSDQARWMAWRWLCGLWDPFQAEHLLSPLFSCPRLHLCGRCEVCLWCGKSPPVTHCKLLD
jgi:hypothetical protein